MTHPAFVDHVLFALLLVSPLIEWRWSWPRYLARLAAGDRGARLRHYRTLLVAEWLPTIALAAFWVWRARSWAALRIAGGTPLRLGVALLCIVAFIVLQITQRRYVLAAPERVERIRKMLVFGEALLPHTQPEIRLFRAVSVTAGVCEEMFYRGFLTWYLCAWMPLVPAVLLCALLFGFGHIYLGPAQVPKTALIGLILSGVVIASGSLWPAMLLHAAIDWNSGELGYRILSQPARPAAQT